MGAFANIDLPDDLTTKEAVRDTILPAINAIANRRLLLQLAAKSGITPDLDAANKEVDIMRQRLGNDAFEAMLEGGIDTQRLITMTAQRQAIRRWIKEKVEPTAVINDQDIEAMSQKFFKTSADQLSEPKLKMLKRQIHALATSILLKQQLAEALKSQTLNLHF